MSPSSLRICIPSLSALQNRSELLALTQQAMRTTRLSAEASQIGSLARRSAYADHVRFLAQLPVRRNRIDCCLVEAAVWHVSGCISRLERWDRGKEIAATWSHRRDQTIAAIPIMDKHAWAAEERHHSGLTRSPIPAVEQMLLLRADLYLGQVLRHATGNG